MDEWMDGWIDKYKTGIFLQKLKKFVFCYNIWKIKRKNICTNNELNINLKIHKKRTMCKLHNKRKNYKMK